MVATRFLAKLDNSAKYLRILTSTMMKKVKNFMKFQENVDWRPLNSPAGLPRNHKKSHGELQKYSVSSKPFKTNDSEAFYKNIFMDFHENSMIFCKSLKFVGFL